ncbi:MAG: hypothetical protein QMD92_00310, partial [bacterium]|nr:hypothetical protein [bacterium]
MVWLCSRARTLNQEKSGCLYFGGIMREFAHTLSDFKKGLRPDKNTPRNSEFATELYNIRCGVAGLEVPPLIVYPISGTPVVSWPLPQLVKVGALTLTETGLFFSRYSAGTLTISKVNSDYSLTSVFTKAGINKRFTVADFGYFQLWAATGLMIKRQLNAGLTGYEWTEVTVGGSPPPATCVCNFRGQLIAGVITDAIPSLGISADNMVAWSEIGSVNPDVMFDYTKYNIDRQRAIGYSGGGTFTSLVSSDDGWWVIGAFFDNTGASTRIGKMGAYGYCSFLRFPNVTIPAGATITSAIIRVQCYWQDPAVEGCQANIYFNNVDDAIAPTSAGGA